MINFRRVGSESPVMRTSEPARIEDQSDSKRSSHQKKTSTSETKGDRWARVYNFNDILEAIDKTNSNISGSQQSLLSDGSLYRSYTCLFEIKGHECLVSSLSFCPSGVFLASACEKGIINIWSVQVSLQVLLFFCHYWFILTSILGVAIPWAWACFSTIFLVVEIGIFFTAGRCY